MNKERRWMNREGRCKVDDKCSLTTPGLGGGGGGYLGGMTFEHPAHPKGGGKGSEKAKDKAVRRPKTRQ